MWFAEGYSFSKQGKWSSAEEAKYSAYVDMWAWALIMLQLATGKPPLAGVRDFASAQLLLEALGLGNCGRVVHGRRDVTGLAMQQNPRFKMGYWQGGSLCYVIQRCLSWSPEARHRASIVEHVCRAAQEGQRAAACPPQEGQAAARP